MSEWTRRYIFDYLSYIVGARSDHQRHRKSTPKSKEKGKIIFSDFDAK